MRPWLRLCFIAILGLTVLPGTGYAQVLGDAWYRAALVVALGA